MDSFKDIIDAFTVTRLSELLTIAESHVRTMRARDSIPPLYWPYLVKNAPDDLKGTLTFEFLRGLRDDRFVNEIDDAAAARPSDEPSVAPKQCEAAE